MARNLRSNFSQGVAPFSAGVPGVLTKAWICEAEGTGGFFFSSANDVSGVFKGVWSFEELTAVVKTSAIVDQKMLQF